MSPSRGPGPIGNRGFSTAQSGHQGSDVLGAVLEIGVEYGNDIPCRNGESSPDGMTLSPAFRDLKQAKTRLFRQVRDAVETAIVRTVVDGYDLQLDPEVRR